MKHLETIMNERQHKTIIFTATKRTADEVTRQLRQDGFPALALHGDKKQSERDWVMSEFKTGRAPILIATDVAARGLGMFFEIEVAVCGETFTRDASSKKTSFLHVGDSPLLKRIELNAESNNGMQWDIMAVA